MKRKFFDSRNLELSLKATATSIITSVLWVVPSWSARYLMVASNMLVLGVVIGLASIIGYLYTWGFIANRVLKIN